MGSEGPSGGLSVALSASGAAGHLPFLHQEPAPCPWPGSGQAGVGGQGEHACSAGRPSPEFCGDGTVPRPRLRSRLACGWLRASACLAEAVLVRDSAEFSFESRGSMS